MFSIVEYITVFVLNRLVFNFDCLTNCLTNELRLSHLFLCVTSAYGKTVTLSAVFHFFLSLSVFQKV